MNNVKTLDIMRLISWLSFLYDLGFVIKLGQEVEVLKYSLLLIMFVNSNASDTIRFSYD